MTDEQEMFRYDMVRAALRAQLAVAIRGRDSVGVAALRSALSALDNATAVPVGQPTATMAIAGLGATEVPRRELTGEETDRIMAGEIADRRAQAEAFDAAHREAEGAVARYQADLLQRVIADHNQPD